MNRNTIYLLMILFVFSFVGCGGGGGDGGVPNPKPSLNTFTGVAAVGDPISGGTIQIKCAGGDSLNTTTNSSGAWTVTFSGQTPPCAVEVNGGTVNGTANTVPYHSIATSAGTVNVTPLTDLMLANLEGTATPDIWFAGLSPSSLTTITPDLVNTAFAKECAALNGLTQLCANDPITADFTPTSGNLMYNLLIALQTALGNTGISYTSLLGDASDPTYTAPAAGFNTALTDAYTAITTTAGFTGDFLGWTGSDDASHSFVMVRVDGKTGAVTTIGGTGYYTSLVYGPDGKLYGIGSSLQILNPADGSASKVGDLVYQGGTPILMADAAFSPNGTLYVLENSGGRIFSVDLTNGTLTLIGTSTSTIRALVFSSSGTLFGSFADLFTISASDASTITTVGTLGVYISSLTFGSGGTLFGMDFSPSTNVYSVDRSTGLATSLIKIDSTGLSTLVAEQTATPISTLSLSASTPVSTPSAPQNVDELLKMEAEVKSARNSLLP